MLWPHCVYVNSVTIIIKISNSVYLITTYYKDTVHLISAKKWITKVAFLQVKGKDINNLLKDRFLWVYHGLSSGVH